MSQAIQALGGSAQKARMRLNRCPAFAELDALDARWQEPRSKRALPSRDSRKGSQNPHWTRNRGESSLESSGVSVNRARKSVKASPLDPKTDMGIYNILTFYTPRVQPPPFRRLGLPSSLYGGSGGARLQKVTEALHSRNQSGQVGSRSLCVRWRQSTFNQQPVLV